MFFYEYVTLQIELIESFYHRSDIVIRALALLCVTALSKMVRYGQYNAPLIEHPSIQHKCSANRCLTSVGKTVAWRMTDLRTHQ